MGNGIYGENQAEERIAENALVEGDVVLGPYSCGGQLSTIGWKGMFQLGLWDRLEAAVKEIRQQWYSEFLLPTQEEGEEAEKYVKRVQREEIKYRSMVDGRITSMLTSATYGECAFARAQGTSLKDGWKIRPKR